MKTNKLAAVEMSMGTIVTIVLLVTALIIGLVFVRNTMCSGIMLTDKITEKVENEVKGLFGTNEYGVKCMGEGGQEIKLGDGGRRQIGCIIFTDEEGEYKLTVKNVKSLRGTDESIVQKWILDKDWEGTVSPGQETVTVLVLDVPKKVSDTSLKIEIEEQNMNTGTTKSHNLYIDISPVGTFTTAVC